MEPLYSYQSYHNQLMMVVKVLLNTSYIKWSVNVIDVYTYI